MTRRKAGFFASLLQFFIKWSTGMGRTAIPPHPADLTSGMPLGMFRPFSDPRLQAFETRCHMY
jgi:hypothetical protein